MRGLLSRALAPATDPLDLLLEVVTFPVWRIVGAGMVFYFDWICGGEQTKRELAELSGGGAARKRK